MTGSFDSLRVADFDYDLPPELIAQTPLEERDGSQLMIVERATGTIRHESIRSLPDELAPNDLVVVNNTRVLPARIHASKVGTGGRVELLLLHRDPTGVWICLARPAKSLKSGVLLHVESAGESAAIEVKVVSMGTDGEVRVKFGNHGDDDLDAIGTMPLPPYIRTPLASAERYQTTFAKIPGSSAAPTAGLHITERIRADLVAREIGWAEVTLHIGLDTFRPIAVDEIAQHRIHKEWCSLAPDVVTEIEKTKSSGGRVVAVGTTSARTLEMWGNQGETHDGFEGWADLFITPGYRWKVVDAMLTNFHLPRSTLLMMVSSFAGIELVRRAYSEAILQEYRFYSFGDAMLVI